MAILQLQRFLLALLLVGGASLGLATVTAAEPGTVTTASPYAQWKNGPSTNANYFPIAVWLQPAKYVKQFQEVGVNLFVGVWKGPTEQHMVEFKSLGMQLICAQTEAALKYKDDPIIVAWLQKDEPDNAQPIAGYWKNDLEAIRKGWPEANLSLEQWGTYGPPVPPKDIVARYERERAIDATRPVFLNLGQGVANPNDKGRGYRRNKTEDYPEYIKGCDIVSFDLYTYSYPDPEVKEKIWLVAQGVDNLFRWSSGKKVVWNFVETTQVYKGGKKPSPAITKAEVWMSIIHGSQGILYYAHGNSDSSEDALARDKEMMAALKEINAQVTALAPVINSPKIADGATAKPSEASAVIDCVAKTWDGATYVFAVGMRPVQTAVTFTVKGVPAKARVEVIGETRGLDAKNGVFVDAFAPYEVHLYRITEVK